MSVNYLTTKDHQRIETAADKAQVALADAFCILGLNANAAMMLAERFSQEAVSHVSEKMSAVMSDA